MSPCTFPALQTFLGQHSTAHGEGGCGSVSEGAGCHAGVTWPRAPGTSNGTPAKSGGPAPSLRKTEEVAKLALAEGSKQPWEAFLCKQLLGCPALGLPCQKKPVCAPGPGSRWAPRVFCPQELSIVQIGLRSRGLSCKANVTEQPCRGWLDIPWECGSPPWVQGPRGQCHCKMSSQPGLPSQG